MTTQTNNTLVHATGHSTGASARNRCLVGSIALLATALLAIPDARAATLIWDANTVTPGAQDGNGNWTVGGATFWDGSADVATVNDLFSDVAQFGTGVALGFPVPSYTVNVSTQSISGLAFNNNIFFPTSIYTLSASTPGEILTLGADGILLTAGAATVGSANLSLALGSDQSWRTSGSLTVSPSLTIAGAMDNGGFKLTLDNAPVTISGVLSGSGDLDVLGTDIGFRNSLILSNAANSFSGITTIAGNGSLSVSALGALGSATSAINLGGTTDDFLDRGTLSYTGTSAVFSRALNVRLGGGAVNVTTAGQTLTFNSPIDTGTNTIFSPTSFDFNGAGNVTVSTGSSVAITGQKLLGIYGGGTVTLQTTTAPSISGAGGLSIDGATLTQNITTSTNLVDSLGTGSIGFSVSGAGSTALNLNNSGGANTYSNSIFVNSNSTGTATIQSISGSATFSGPVRFSASGGTPTLQLANSNPTAGSLLQFTGGFTGTGNLQLRGTGTGGAITVATGQVDNVGTVSNTGTNANATTTISAVIGPNVSSVLQNGAAPMILSAPNTYTGPTTANNGNMIISGTLSGTSGVTVNAAGKVSLDNNVNNIINPAATMRLNGGMLAVTNSVSGKNQTFGTLTLTGASVMDFGTGPAGNALTFGQNASFASGTLQIWNWTGSLYAFGATDNGTIGDGQDRLLFGGAGSGLSGAQLANVRFFTDSGVTQFGSAVAQIPFAGGGFELVPVPEPSSTALLAVGSLLFGLRRRAAGRRC